MLITADLPKNNVKLFHQIYASAVVSFTIFMAAFWTMYISPLLLKFERKETPFRISSFEKSWIVSIMDFGNFLSAVPAGFIMDKTGRKCTLMLSAAIYAAASILAIFATGGIHLFAARLLAGIGKGFSFTVAPIYIAEISSKNIRGALMSTFFTFFCGGVILAAGVGPYVPFDTYNYVSLCMPTLFICLMLPLPESMYHYVKNKKLDRAERALKWFRHTDTKFQKTETEKEMMEIQQEFQNTTQKQGSYIQLFSDSINRKALIIVAMVGLAQRFGGISYMLSYGATDLPDSRHRFNREHCFAAFSVCSLISNLCSGFLIDHIGRKPVLLFSTTITSAAMFIGAFYFQQLHSRNDPIHYWIPYTVEIIFSIAFTAGLGVLPATLQGELCPANIKRQASAVVVMILSLGSFGVNMSHEYVVKYWGVAGNYYVAALSSLFFSVWCYFNVFETKGKTLLEIQKKLVNRTE